MLNTNELGEVGITRHEADAERCGVPGCDGKCLTATALAATSDGG